MLDPLSVPFLLAALFLVIQGLAFVTDVRTFRIPNAFCLALLLLYPAHVLAGGGEVDWLSATGIAVLIFALGLLPFAKGWMGGGDVKLLAATALWLAPDAVLSFLLVTAAIGGGLALIMVSRLRFVVAQAANGVGLTPISALVLGRTIPYGIAIATAAWIVGGPYLLAANSIQ